MRHDFLLTDRHVVLLDLPVTSSMDAAAGDSRLRYTWNPADQARVGLLSRAGGPGAVRWFEIDPCFVFHTLGGYDDADRVVVDLCRYHRSYDVAALTGPGPLTLDRWIIDPAAGKLTTRRIDDRHQEFPRVDDRRTGQPHRYGYTAVISAGTRATLSYSGDLPDDAFRNALLKYDLTAGSVQAHDFDRDAYVGEAVFAPAPPDAAEDDGYVLALVYDPDRGVADLVVLAAPDFTAEPVARVHLAGPDPARLARQLDGRPARNTDGLTVRMQPSQAAEHTADGTRRTRLANERTYLAWRRTGFAAFAVSIGAGKLVPALTHATRWPYLVLGAGFALLGVVHRLRGHPRPTRRRGDHPRVLRASRRGDRRRLRRDRHVAGDTAVRAPRH